MEEGELAVAAADGATSDVEPSTPSTPAARAPSVGERRARVAKLVEEHGVAVRGLCVRLLRDQSLADDVVQQVFINAYRDLDRFEGRSSPRTWLFGIASHRCLDAIKSRHRRMLRIESNEPAMLAFEAPASEPIERIDHARRIAALEACLELLPEEMRAAVLLRFQTEATYEELELRLGASANTLQVRVARALPRLRRCLNRRGWRLE